MITGAGVVGDELPKVGVGGELPKVGSMLGTMPAGAPAGAKLPTCTDG